MNEELQNLLDNYEQAIYGYTEPIIPSIHQIHLLLDYISQLGIQVKKQKEINQKAIEYITSYESISTIQGLTCIEANKQFDEKTMTEMTNRYLLVHDKLLEILEEKEVSE